MLINRGDMRPSIQEAIDLAREDPEFILLPGDLVLQKDEGFDDAGMYIVVSKTVDCQHWDDRFTCVGHVVDFQ